jgi:hypothetical protein
MGIEAAVNVVINLGCKKNMKFMVFRSWATKVFES